MASRFDLQSLTQVPAFLVAAMKIRKPMLDSPGLLGLSLTAKPLSKTFYTLSAWQDRAALDTAGAREPHRHTMGHFYPRIAHSRFVFRTVARSGLPPEWPDGCDGSRPPNRHARDAACDHYGDLETARQPYS